MPPNAPEDVSRAIETLYRSERARILATLVCLLGDLDLAEEAMHDPALKFGTTWEIRRVGDMNEIIQASEQRRRKAPAR